MIVVTPESESASAQLQMVLLAVSGVLFCILTGLIAVLWKLRGALNLLIIKELRAYLTTEEGEIFMDGIINGKVRQEISNHNEAGDAHFERLKDYATVSELTGGMNSVRASIDRIGTDAAKGRSDAVEEIKKVVADSVEEIVDRLERRKG